VRECLAQQPDADEAHWVTVAHEFTCSCRRS
jgi:hypothetical protein